MEALSPKDAVIVDFFKGLRIVLNNAAAYPKEHPYFIKSAQAFKEKVDALLAVMNPILFTCTPESVFIDGKSWQKEALFVDIAQIFHFRKIKGVQIGAGVSLDEIIAFVGVIGMPKRDVVRQGGANVLLANIAHPHLEFEELDYSQFLVGGDIEVDVWMYLISKAMDKHDANRIMQFAETFGAVLKKIKIEDIINDEGLRSQVSRFIGYLNENNKEKLRDCSGKLFDVLNKYKAALRMTDLEKVRSFFGSIDEESLGKLLWNQMKSDATLDTTSINLFARLSAGRQPKLIGDALTKAAELDGLQAPPEVVKRIRSLVDMPNWDSVSEVYRGTIASLAQRIAPERSLTFSYDDLKKNYRNLLLALVGLEQDTARLKNVFGRIAKDWDGITKDRDCQYMLSLAEIMQRRMLEPAADASMFEDVRKRITQFVEAAVWEAVPPECIQGLIALVQTSARDEHYYVGRIFTDGAMNALVLLLYFKFFPQSIEEFYRGIESRRQDVAFMVKLTGALNLLEPALSKEIRKHIFKVCNIFIKLEVLKSLKDLTGEDEEFLLGLVKSGDKHIKRQALGVLSTSPRAGYAAATILFDIPNFLGFNNAQVLEHLALADENNLKDARPYLVALSGRKMFWYSSVRSRALRILEKWNA